MINLSKFLPSFIPNVYRACSFFTNLDLFCIHNARVIYRKIRYIFKRAEIQSCTNNLFSRCFQSTSGGLTSTTDDFQSTSGRLTSTTDDFCIPHADHTSFEAYDINRETCVRFALEVAFPHRNVKMGLKVMDKAVNPNIVS